MTDSICPPWAFKVWCNVDHIYAELPAIGGHTTHTVRVTNDVVGLSKLLILARSRDLDSKLGMKGDPTQAQIEKLEYDPAMIKRAKPKLSFTASQRINARDVLRKLGMI